jgi:CBS domain containing-hemolysin-like protein
MVRRVGIALGSLVAASLAVGLVAGLCLSLFGLNTTSAAGQDQLSGGVVLTVVTIILGGLIYRDIIRREQRQP